MLSTPQSAVQHETLQPVQTDTTASKAPGKKTIFLTFDDGPLKGTENVLEVLNKEKVPATMFMVGKHISMNRPLYEKALASPYVTIANHTYSHANGHYRAFYCNCNALLKDVQHTDALLSSSRQIVAAAAFHPLRLAGRNVFRLPSVSCDDHGVGKCQKNKERPGYDTLAKAGFLIYGWDIEWRFDTRNGRPLKSVNDIVNNLETMYTTKRSVQHDKIILLMHDFMFRDCFRGKENLAALIRMLKQKGWEFAGIETYI